MVAINERQSFARYADVLFKFMSDFLFLAVTKRVNNKALNDVIEKEKNEDANSPPLVNLVYLLN